MPTRHEIRICYSTLTDESASHGDHADHGYMHPDGYRLGDDARDVSLQWELRDALQFMSERCNNIETDWTPDIGTGVEFGSRWFSGTGNTSDCEGDEIEVCYDLFIKGVSDGTSMRLARLMVANGVYFANWRQRRVG